MKKISFNQGWIFHKSSDTTTEGTAVTLPHDAMILEHRDPNLITGHATGYYPYNTICYTKEFTIEDIYGVTYLEFEGIYKNATIYLNGCLTSQHTNGYTPFIVNATPYLRQGLNKISILVRNGLPTSRWYSGTGIERDIWLYHYENLHIKPNGIMIRTLEADSAVATLLISTTINNCNNNVEQICLHHKVEMAEVSSIVTMMPNQTKTVTLKMEISSPKLWSVEKPYLYECETAINNMESQRTRFGIRCLSLDSKRGLRINGEGVKLQGGCIHHDHGVVGAIEHQALTRRRIRKLRDVGYNAIRCAHFPASREVLDACDEMGMLVMLELCDAWTMAKVDFDYSVDFAEHWEEDTRAMVMLAYNHPSVIFYSIGNEIKEVSNPIEAQYGRKICDLIRSLDPSRYITNCVNIALSLMDQLPQLAMKANADINSIMNGDTGALMQFMASKAIAEPLEEAFSYLDFAGYNYASYRYEVDTDLYPQRIILGTECYPGSLYDNWELCKRFPQIIGDFGWAAWDYLGEAGVGQHRYNQTKDNNLYGQYPYKTANCGDFDIIGQRRPISYWREIVWNHRNKPYIAVQNPAHFGEKQSPTRWGWSDAERCWNFSGFEGHPIVVGVYSNAEEVELFCNKGSLGRVKPKKCKAFFETIFNPGELLAINYQNGVETGRDQLLSASDNVHIATFYYGDGITEISVVDENGTLNPSIDLSISATVDDGMTILGFGTADPQGLSNYFDHEIKTFHGRALIVTKGNGNLIIKEA